MPRSLSLAVLAVLAAPGLALAQAPAAGAPANSLVAPYAVLVAGFAMAFAAGLCALGQGRAVASAVDAMARQPGAAARIQIAMIIGLALIVFFAYHWIGVRKQGALTYLAHFAGPVPLAIKPLMFVIEIISHLARPLSLTLRLFGNMVGGHILLAIVFFLMGLQGLIGWAHPVAVLAGYSALPVIVLAHGLRLARESRPWR